MNASEASGYLELFIGPMFSGKTSKLIEIYNQLILCNQNVLVINYNQDSRYPNYETLLSSHDQNQIPCIRSSNLKEIFDIEISKDDDKLDKIMCSSNQEQKDKINYIINPLHEKYVKYILINEGQFFPDLYEWVYYMVNILNKHIYIAGLDGDYNRKPIGDILQLIPESDKTTKLSSICLNCKNGKKALFSHRKTSETAQIVIGTDNYLPLCRECYNCKNSIKTDISAYSTSEYVATFL
tara:strand:- start:2529 stop:3245 length:717 start_codon:yes stop_codon:yes gene_type:complete